jgi:hypothetical protein
VCPVAEALIPQALRSQRELGSHTVFSVIELVSRSRKFVTGGVLSSWSPVAIVCLGELMRILIAVAVCVGI